MEVVSIEFKEAPSQLKSRTGKDRRSQVKTVSLSALTPKLNLDPPTASDQDWTHDPIVENRVALTWTDSETYDGIGLGTNQGRTVAQAGFLSSLWRMVDQYIEENPFLSEYNRTGRVYLRFEVDKEGRLLQIQASASDRVLKVIAARAVRRALRNETGDVRPPDQGMWVNARFSWAGYQACARLRGHRGSNLSFCHYAEIKRRKFTTDEKVATWVGAIAQHGPWAYEEIQKYNREHNRRRTRFNPFEKYEHDPDWDL